MKDAMMTRRWAAASDDQAAEEARILARAREAPADFAPLYERYFPRIYAYCLRRVGTAEEAEDLTSAVFTRALTGLGGYRGGSVAAWLFRIAHNAVANHHRDRRPPLPLDPAAVAGAQLSGASGDPTLERLVRDEEHERIARLIAALPDEQRELLALKVAGGLSAREIGAVLGKSEGAVRVALHRVVRGLRAAYRGTEEE
jgi:RNA polymerase sigma-70 factor (ECF subfamily)